MVQSERRDALVQAEAVNCGPLSPRRHPKVEANYGDVVGLALAVPPPTLPAELPHYRGAATGDGTVHRRRAQYADPGQKCAGRPAPLQSQRGSGAVTGSRPSCISSTPDLATANVGATTT